AVATRASSAASCSAFASPAPRASVCATSSLDGPNALFPPWRLRWACATRNRARYARARSTARWFARGTVWREYPEPTTSTVTCAVPACAPLSRHARRRDRRRESVVAPRLRAPPAHQPGSGDRRDRRGVHGWPRLPRGDAMREGRELLR